MTRPWLCFDLAAAAALALIAYTAADYAYALIHDALNPWQECAAPNGAVVMWPGECP